MILSLAGLHQTAKRHGLALPARTWRSAMEVETTTRGHAHPDAVAAGFDSPAPPYSCAR